MAAEPVSYAELISPELDQAMMKILKSGDPLDRPGFDPISYVNEIFPNDHSLSNLELVNNRLRQKIELQDKEIKDLLKRQSEANTNTQGQLEEATSSIKGLFDKLKEIRDKAEHSEKMVQEITRDIKTLDSAKHNLTTTVTVLKRLTMLVSAINQLKHCASQRQYEESAKLLQAVKELSDHFNQYQNIPQIAVVKATVNNIKNDLKLDIFEVFESGFIAKTLSQDRIPVLRNGCSVIEVLGIDIRDSLITWYCDQQLEEYKNLFCRNTELSTLDELSRRYGWLKRLLKLYEEEHSHVFPETWSVCESLCYNFCKVTRKDLIDVLGRIQSMDVKLLLKSLQLTLELENQLARKFQDLGSDKPLRESKFIRSISISFEQHLSHYVEAESNDIAVMIEKWKQEEISVPEIERGIIAVLPSSTDLFYSYKQTLLQFSKFSTGKPMVNLGKMFSNWLGVYSEILQEKVGKEEKKSNLKAIGILLNTAEYCLTTTAELEQTLQSKIDPEYKDQIDLNTTRDKYINVTTECIRVLIREAENSFESGFNAMAKMPWGTLQHVGDQSEYVTQIGIAMKPIISTVRGIIRNPKYFRSYCDRLIESLITRFKANIYRVKPVCEVGAEQLLLDIQAIKSFLLEFHKVGEAPPCQFSSTYSRFVTEKISSIEDLLKIIITPVDPPEGLVETYLFLFEKEGDIYDFQRLLDLKGLKKGDQSPLVNLFQQRAPHKCGPKAAAPSLLTTAPTNITAIPAANLNPTSQSTATDTSTKFNENFRKFMAGMSKKKQGPL